MKIEIKNQSICATINPFGAYVESFYKGKNPIFFPKVLSKIGDKLKTRGGMHPCLPNFGLDEISNLSQHGFGRDEYWQVIENNENSVRLKLLGIDDYVGVDFEINYSVEQNIFLTQLEIVNTTEEEKNIGPGFHPYFYCEDMNVEIEGFDIEKKKLEETIFLDSNKLSFYFGDRHIEIEGKNINVFALWTDYFGDYLCVEPTFNSKSFTKEINNPYKLKAKEKFVQEFVIKVD